MNEGLSVYDACDAIEDRKYVYTISESGYVIIGLIGKLEVTKSWARAWVVTRNDRSCWSQLGNIRFATAEDVSNMDSKEKW